MRIIFYYYFDEPGKKEDHGYEVEEGFPRRQAVRGAIHQKYPALLRGRLVDSEYAC